MRWEPCLGSGRQNDAAVDQGHCAHVPRIGAQAGPGTIVYTHGYGYHPLLHLNDIFTLRLG
jgi:hypothetical protein